MAKLRIHTTTFFDYDAEFNNYFSVLRRHSKKYNNFTLVNVEKILSLPDMYTFIYKTYERYYNGTLGPRRIHDFKSIDFPFDFGLVNTSNFTAKDFWFGYKFAKEYFEFFHTFDFDVNLMYDGFELGKWYLEVEQQTFVSNIPSILLDYIQYKSKKQKILTNKWIAMFALASKYNEQYGPIVPPLKIVFDGEDLGSWIALQRSSYKNGTLSNTAIKLLETINFQWLNPQNHKEIYCLGIVREYQNTHGSLQKPYDSFEVAKAISYLASLKKNRTISPTAENELISFSNNWDDDATSYYNYAKQLQENPNFFADGYRYLECTYQKYNYPLLIDSFRRGWAERVCILHKYHLLKKEEYDQLKLIKFDFDFTELCWRTGMYFLEQFMADGEDLYTYFNNNRMYKTYGISFWLNTQAKAFNENRLTRVRLNELEALGVDLQKLLISRDIHHHFECIEKYLTTGENISTNFSINESSDIIRDAKRRGILHPTTISELNALGFNW